MSHIMRPQSFGDLLRWIIREYEENGSILGIHRSLFFNQKAAAPYAAELFGGPLATPIGPAAGPNTQLTQNIVASWLTGARFIELKTVQIMDDLELGRPCIDMEDEGYNAEWSQELRLENSIQEYVKAWVLIRVLCRLLGWSDEAARGTIFNLSVGYNLEGILTPRMQKFIATMLDASAEIAAYKEILRNEFPQFSYIDVPNALVNSCTLSTMHGCPPDEIGRIARYLLEDRGFHLAVKLNPTLLGKKDALKILHDDLGYTGIDIPDPVFEHDLKYAQALEIISMLKQSAAKRGKFFGVKLSNTFAMANYRGVMPGNEMYMSGRSLYPVTMNLWNRLSKEFKGDLAVSYSAGADAMNVSTILSCGALPVTVASDILKPGGYARFGQYIENVEAAMNAAGAKNLGEFAANRTENLERAAKESLESIRYKKKYFAGSPKVDSPLGLFDCVEAPCMAQCAVCQDVPAYASQIARGDYDGALRTILRKNPLPGLTGHVCTHLCETRCTRANYDEAVGIRDLKRAAAEYGTVNAASIVKNDKKVAVIGAGPSGLAAASALALAGVNVTVYEARSRAGGMMAIAPEFRLPHAVMDADVKRITDMGVKIELNHKVAKAPESLLADGFDAVYVACGFPKDAPLGCEGSDAKGVWTALDLLEQVANGKKPDLGKKILVVGGGNTAMDAARTAQRLAGAPVTVVYRRTKSEMPAIEEERVLLFEEGNELVELAAPLRVVVQDGVAKGLECERTKLGEPDASGRRSPVPTGEKFIIDADSIVVAIGQSSDTAIFKDSKVALKKNGATTVACNGRTKVAGVYAGGDMTTGPAIVIQACADGARAAEAICRELGVCVCELPQLPTLSESELLEAKRARTRKAEPNREYHLPVESRTGFALVEQTLSKADASAEAARCLQCAQVCDKCVEVCPNRANYSYTTETACTDAPVLARRGGALEVVRTDRVHIKQSRQIIHVDDFCNECGNCSAFCVHEGRPYADKPRVYLNDVDFASEKDNAFRVSGLTIRRREDGREMSLRHHRKGYDFENDVFKVSLDRGFKVVATELKTNFDGEISLRPAVEMAVLFSGIANSMPWLIQN